ncbi:amidohydrolase family protein [Acetobacter musti]|uniref:Adenine deaminase n=1 Tax=Acetobacter musti TaxID=864732 RepID=A0ABX0JMD6_9PROT|nr:adenine deaminase C-terminal domain-containing protein [Acetobacter musti]NHN84536.1 amidohydrolase family protein [Acetobacter musti]
MSFHRVRQGICSLVAAVMMFAQAESPVAVAAVPTASTLPHPITFSPEIRTRQTLVQVALEREPADLIIRNATVLNVYTLTWEKAQDIVVRDGRIAWVGPVGAWKGKAAQVYDATGRWAVPGFGESHKHIESSMLSPEWEAALVIPLGNTWTTEGSHEFANVSGEHNVEFWLTPEKMGSPLKIFPALGSATPPSAFELGGGNYAYREIAENIRNNPRVQGLDEVMDWPAVSTPSHPGYQRIWENIQATVDTRGVVDGHGAGLSDLDRIDAFAAAGLSSDHETKMPEEAWDKLQRGIFLQLRDDNIERAVPLFLKKGLANWSSISFVTDDRNVADTLKQGTMDHHVRLAIQLGVPPEAAFAMASLYPARHGHMDQIVGSIAPGRYADVVLLSSVRDVAIREVFASGRLAAKDGQYLLDVPKIRWPAWASDTIHVGRALTADDFVIRAPAGRTTQVTAAIQAPFYTDPEQKTAVLPVVNGVVQRDIGHDIVKVATVDRYWGKARLGKMFWTGLGPRSPDSAIATSVSHDLHNITVIGTSDAAMATAVNRIEQLRGGIVLVDHGKITAEMQLEIGGLMTSRPVKPAAADMEHLYSAADSMEWIGEPGFPRRVIFAMITCSPFTWRLVVPYPGNPGGLVLLQTGQTMPTVW